MAKFKIKNVLILIILSFNFFFNKEIINFEGKRNLISLNPKISVIIPIYNGGKYLNYSLKSVQNQNMKDIEIIIIDDNSNDNSLEIIKNYMKTDKRIRLIENRENRKILFCKSLAVLNSKGKYIIELDQDDMFIKNYAFDFIYNESEKYELDLLNFKYISGKNIDKIPKINNNISDDNIIEIQPELKFSIFKPNIIILWGNLIRSDLYKKIIYNLWPIIINYKIIFQEDFLITFFLLIYADRFKKIKNIFYYHFLHKNEVSNRFKKNPEYFLSVILIGIIYYDYYVDYYNQYLQNIINYIHFLKKDFKKIKFLFPNLFIYFFIKILTNKQIQNEHKIFILNYFKISETQYSNLYINKTYIPNKNQFSFKKINQTINISIIIVCSDYEKIINLINSINNQNSQFFEIILIYDDEHKIDYNLIENFIKPFEHIKLIDNKYKKGKIYSIYEGINKARGKYLLILNPNCFFLTEDDLKNMNEEIIKENADVMEIDLYTILQNNYINLYKCKHYISSFDMNHFKYNLEFNDIDIKRELLTNKIFKINYLKKAINKYKIYDIDKIIDYYSDNIFNFIIESTNHEFKHISSVKIYINDTDIDKYIFQDFNSEKNQYLIETLLYINFIFDKSENTYENKEKVLKEFYNLLSIIYNKFTKITNSSIDLFNKFMKCKYISQEHKILLKFYYDSLIC